MRRLASIGLLALLLYNMFGLSLAVLFFEKDYQIATTGDPGQALVMKMYLPSIPYAQALEIDQNIQGLVRQDGQFYNPTQVLHHNDTLYVTLQSNEAARDHFFELANAIQMLNDPQTDLPQSPYSKAVELMGSLLKICIPDMYKFSFAQGQTAHYATSVVERPFQGMHYLSYQSSLATPPPERA